MADYKRMVSYMYQYENGVKKKNVGYARIEARNGQCKLNLHMQLLGQLDSIFPTYLIHRKDNKIDLIYLGDSLLKNQVMDSRFVANELNVMDSGHELSDMGGLLLFLNDNVYFATEWDDKPIVAKEVLEALKPKKESEPEIALAAIETMSTIEEQSLQPPMEESFLEESPETEEQGQDEIEESEQISLEDELKIPFYKLPRGWKTIERLYYNQPDVIREYQSPMSNPLGQSEELRVNENRNGVVTDSLAEQGDSTQESFIAQATDKSLSEEMEGSISKEDIEEFTEHPTAKQFFDNFPRIFPFEDNEIILCVKIEPADLGKLPKEIWALSSNSFLMHSFYCYHHLIFAKRKDRYGSEYILGIPGIYHSRERFMARMFGFECFKSIRKRELKQGDFGYWYLPVHFSD